jgi:hypothetical protein
MEKNFNHEESLALINEMINRAQNNYQKNTMHSMIFWGYAVAFTAIINCILMHWLSNPNLSFLVWLVIIPGWIVTYFIDQHVAQITLVKTYFDKITHWVWRGFGIGTFLFVASIFVVAYRINDYDIMELITSVMMIMMGICEFVMGSIYRYKLWYYIAILFWVGAVSCAFLSVDLQFIVLAACMILGFVIPGHLLNHKKKKNHV